MLRAALILACLAILADAYTTRAGLRQGRTEMWLPRRFLIRVLGINGGTFGMSILYAGAIVAGNVWSGQSATSLMIGNAITVAGFGYVAWRNWRIVKGT